MQHLWSYVVMGLLTLLAAAAVAGGEPASAELRFAEAATAAAVAGVAAVVPEPAAMLSTDVASARID